MQWLCISLVFEKASLFEDMARTVLRQATGPIQTVGLPIQHSVEGEKSYSSFKER